MPDTILDLLSQQFVALDGRSRLLLERLEPSLLYARPVQIESEMAAFSCGEFILRSAARVEQTFGGITTRLWDDPFEWTLPEKLATVRDVNQYLDEVEAVRLRGFSQFSSASDLERMIPAPSELKPLGELLLDTLAAANHFQGKAYAVFRLVAGAKEPPI